MKNILLAFLLLFSASANATTISLSSLPAVTRAGSVKYTEALGYRFETQIYGTMIAKPSGLWNGDAFGTTTPITISRIDDGLFSLDDLTITTHAAFACGGNFCGIDAVHVDGTLANGVSVFSQFLDTGYASALQQFTLTDPQYKALASVMIYTTDSFVLNSINLTAAPVPLPAAAWLFSAGLMFMLHKSKRSNPL